MLSFRYVLLFITIFLATNVGAVENPFFVIYNKIIRKPLIKVAVIDTGFDFKSNWGDIDDKVTKEGKRLRRPNICKDGHKDFTNTNIQDNHGHGTHIAGNIATFAGKSRYCLVIIKAYDGKSKVSAFDSVANSFLYAAELKVDIINYSGGGEIFSFKEYKAIQTALNNGIVIVAAAGNEAMRVDYSILSVKTKQKGQSPYSNTVTYTYTNTYIHGKNNKVSVETQSSYFPASYDPRIMGVTNTQMNGKLNPTSNYGDAFQYKEMGTEVYSILPGNSYGYMTGTSQSTATKTGKIIKNWKK